MATAVINEVEEQSLIPIPEYPALRADGLSLKQRAQSLEIKSVGDYLLAGELAKSCRLLLDQVDSGYDSLIAMAYRLHKAILGKKNGYAADVTVALSVLKTKMGSYNAEQERFRRSEEARLQEELRVAAAAEARRVSEDQAILDAIEAEDAGDAKAADALLNNPVPVQVYVPSVILPKCVPQVQGISSRQTWSFRVTDINLVPRKYLVVDEKTVGGIARALKDKTEIPGIEVFPVDSVAVRR